LSVIREDLTKRALADAGIEVPRGGRALSVGEAATLGADIGFPLYVKSLLPIGKKNRIGAVRRVATDDELRVTAAELAAVTVGDVVSDGILVEKAVDGGRELFVSMTFSSMARGPVVMISTAGGVDVEESVDQNAEAIVIVAIDPHVGPQRSELVEAASEVGLVRELAAKVASEVARMWRVFCELDLVTLEINPLIVATDGTLVAAGVLADLDDAAVFRHPQLAGQAVGRFGGRGPTGLEQQVRALSEQERGGSAMVVEIPDGDLAWMWAGGGCSMYAADACERLGGRPRTYFDATTLSRETLTQIMIGVLSLPGIRGFGIGSNVRSMVRVDEEMEAILEALRVCGLDDGSFPVVARLAGPGEDEARALAREHPAIELFGRHDSIDEAIARLVERTTGEVTA